MIGYYYKSIVNFFFPNFCYGCNAKLEENENVLCPACTDSIKLIPEDILLKEFDKKFAHDKYIAGFTSAYIFENEGVLQKLIHELKYNKRFSIGTYLGIVTSHLLIDTIEEWNIDQIIPIPLFHLKKAERGYNQAYYISKGISSFTKIPISKKSLRRNVFTPSQTKLNTEERKNNVGGVFKIIDKRKIKNKNIMLVDDVITTGATISECARMLKSAGAKNIYACSVALANPLHSFGSA